MRFGPLAAAAGLVLALGACSSHPDRPDTVTADEAQQLNDAAAALDANSMDVNAAAGDNESDSR